LIRETHRAFKRASQILIDTTLEIEADLSRVTQTNKSAGDVNEYWHWLRIVAACYESFVWLAFRPCDVQHLFKGPRSGFLDQQNISSVLKIAKEINDSFPYALAIPLDFTRFSCTGDLLCIGRTFGKSSVAVVEVKQGEVNDALIEARKSRNADAWSAFFEKYGEKGISQAERVFRQEREYYKREARMRAKSGIHKDEDGTRLVLESNIPAADFTDVIEALCAKARRGEYAVDAVDGCLMIAAVDTTSEKRALLADFDARLFALNAFIAAELAKESPDKIAGQLQRIELIDWLEGFGAICFMPLFVRPLRARTFLDLAFGRVRLLAYFHPPAFVELCQKLGVKAELLSRKQTNRLRSVQGWRALDLPPMHEGRAIAYWVGELPFVIGSMRFHEMVFNWTRPASLILQIKDGIARQTTNPSLVDLQSNHQSEADSPLLDEPDQ
jgi:hypothetical protein